MENLSNYCNVPILKASCPPSCFPRQKKGEGEKALTPASELGISWNSDTLIFFLPWIGFSLSFHELGLFLPPWFGVTISLFWDYLVPSHPSLPPVPFLLLHKGRERKPFQAFALLPVSLTSSFPLVLTALSLSHPGLPKYVFSLPI